MYFNILSLVKYIHFLTEKYVNTEKKVLTLGRVVFGKPLPP